MGAMFVLLKAQSTNPSPAGLGLDDEADRIVIARSGDDVGDLDRRACSNFDLPYRVLRFVAGNERVPQVP